MSESTKLQICTVQHRHGTNTYACLGAEEDIKRQVGDTFCTEWWDELDGKAGFMPADGVCIFDLYFEDNAEESATLSAIDLYAVKGGIVLGFTNQELKENLTNKAFCMLEHGVDSREHAALCSCFLPTLALATELRAAHT